MDRQLIDYIPDVLKDVREFKAVLRYGEQSEFDALWDGIADVLNDQFVYDATETGISRWEKVLKIKPKSTEDLDARRFRVLARLNESLPYTLTALREMLEILCGSGGYDLRLINDEYRLVVKIALTSKSKYDEAGLLLRRVVPANMIVDVSLMYNTWDTIKGYTWGGLKVKTWREIKEEML